MFMVDVKICVRNISRFSIIFQQISQHHHLVLLNVEVIFSIYVAFLQPTSILLIIKQFQPSLWDEKLVVLRNSQGRPYPQVLYIGRLTQASQRRSPPAIN